MKLNKNVVLATLGSLAIAASLAFAGTASAQLNLDDSFGSGDATNLGLSTQTDLRTAILDIVQYVLGFLGLAGVILVIYGGVVWMTAAGNDSKVASAKKIIYTALVGLIIVLFAYSITAFVLDSFANEIK